MLLALLFALPALADPSGPKRGDEYFNPGLLLSASPMSVDGVLGVGAELSYHQFHNDYGGGMGVFGQWQAMNFLYHRFCGGIQGTGELELLPVGAELGVTYTTPGVGKAATTSLHVAPFISVGVATASLRFDIPIMGGNREQPRHGIDIGLALALKFPREL